ncbi:MAG: flagellin B, partial [Sulfuricurvum sp. MLSB]
MGFRINTNIAAMNAHMFAQKTNAGLDKSLASLSSGLRINKAADDASGMSIADSLRQQAQGLGQAIRNANDGVGVVQTADGALDEYTNIINTIRTKAIQAASDGQSTDSRAAIQSDIDRLLEEAQNIASTTSFNGLTLLNGGFQNKAFHIGAYSGETVKINIDDAQIASVG